MQYQYMGNNRSRRLKNLITYLHNEIHYTDPNPSSVCYQRQHQGELCPDSHRCINSTYNTNNIAAEQMGPKGMGLVAQPDILPDEVIAVFGNATILQDTELVQEFADLINAYNLNHPTQGFQYSIFYPVASDSHPSAVIPNQDRTRALTVPTISKRLRSRLKELDPQPGSAQLANHTCCLRHRMLNSRSCPYGRQTLRYSL